MSLWLQAHGLIAAFLTSTDLAKMLDLNFFLLNVQSEVKQMVGGRMTSGKKALKS